MGDTLTAAATKKRAGKAIALPAPSHSSSRRSAFGGFGLRRGHFGFRPRLAEPRIAAAHHLRVIYQLTSLTSQLTDKQELLKSVMEMVFREFKPERGFIVLTKQGDPDQPKPAVVKYRTAPASEEEAKIHIPRTILQHVLKKSEGVLSSNAMNDPRFAAGDSVQRLHIRSAICSPILFRDRSFGVIYIDSSLANYTFTGGQLALLNAIGQHTGLALANAELYSQKLHRYGQPRREMT